MQYIKFTLWNNFQIPQGKQNYKHMKKTLLLIILAIILIPTGCKKKEEPKPEPPKPNTGEVIVADNTKVMDLTTRQAIASIDTANYTFVFNTETDFVKNLKVGDILVDSTSDKAP